MLHPRPIERDDAVGNVFGFPYLGDDWCLLHRPVVLQWENNPVVYRIPVRSKGVHLAGFGDVSRAADSQMGPTL